MVQMHLTPSCLYYADSVRQDRLYLNHANQGIVHWSKTLHETYPPRRSFQTDGAILYFIIRRISCARKSFFFSVSLPSYSSVPLLSPLTTGIPHRRKGQTRQPVLAVSPR